MINNINEYVENVERIKALSLQNLNFDCMKHMSAKDFELCKDMMKLLDDSIELVKQQSNTLNSIERKQYKILLKLDDIMNK